MGPHHHEPAELPPYRAIMVVDMRDFSGQPGRDHSQVTEQIPVLLGEAFTRCGRPEVWESVTFHGTTGDGYVAGFDPRHLPFLLNPYLPALQKELEFNNRTWSGPDSIRMRVSITVGPMTDSGSNSISDGSGDTRIEAHRMVDDDSVRDLLTRSGSVTCVAAIVSSRVYEDAVAAGYTGDDPELYVPVDVRVKAYQGPAYLNVPKPSGDLLRKGFGRPETDQPRERGTESRTSDAPSEATARFIAVGDADQVGQAISGQQVTVHHTDSNTQIHNPQVSGDGMTFLGDNNGDARHRVNKGKDMR